MNYSIKKKQHLYRLQNVQFQKKICLNSCLLTMVKPRDHTQSSEQAQFMPQLV